MATRNIVRSALTVTIAALSVSMTHAAEVTIPWKQNFTYTTDEVFDSKKPDSAGRTGRTFRFMNGAPEEGKKVEKTGNLRGDYIQPDGITGPLPVVILMHGCTGWTKPVLDWAKEKGKMLLDQGIGVLVLDSFGPRQVKKTCGPPNCHWGWRRVEDAYSAIAWLIDNKRADPDRVFVMGRSNGAQRQSCLQQRWLLPVILTTNSLEPSLFRPLATKWKNSIPLFRFPSSLVTRIWPTTPSYAQLLMERTG